MREGSSSVGRHLLRAAGSVCDRSIVFGIVLKGPHTTAHLVRDSHLSGSISVKAQGVRGRARVADDRLIQVSNLYVDVALNVSYWTYIASVTIPTDPNVRTRRN